MQKVWERKRNNGLDKFDTYTYKEYEKIQFDANNLDSAFMKRKSSISLNLFLIIKILPQAEKSGFLFF
jgi:hypothetical protein